VRPYNAAPYGAGGPSQVKGEDSGRCGRLQRVDRAYTGTRLVGGARRDYIGKGVHTVADQEQRQRTREDLLNRSRERHNALVALIDQVPEEDLTRPGVGDAWSVKDHMAHLTWWEQRVLRVLGGEPDPIEAVPPRADIEASGQDGQEESEEDQLARVNAYVRAQSLHLPLDEVRATFDASYQEMLRLIQTAPDDELAKYYDWISGNAADHYDEHIGWIGAWMERENLPRKVPGAQ
jgi:hypothetical protein